MPPKKKGSSKGKKVKPPSAAELAEQSRVALEAEMLAVRSYITGAISSALSEALDSAVERERGGRARDVTAATYVYMVERAVGALQPRLIRDEGDCVMGEVKRGEMDGQEEEPRPADIDRMATAAVVRKDGLSDFCRTQRVTMRGSMDEGEKGSNITMWGGDGPSAYGFSSLSNDPRADVPRLKALFDYMDLNNSGDISLDEMQWFLELQGQSMKRTEFQLAVEELGITGANAPLTRTHFIQFLLQRLRDNPKACFEVRASEKVEADPNRATDAKELKKLLADEKERLRVAKEIKSRPRKKSSWRAGHAKTSHDHGKTEFIMKSWEELERLRAGLPNYLVAQLGRVTNYDPAGDARRAREKEASGKSKRRTTRRPGTAPKSQDKELARIDDESSMSFKSLKDGRRSESPKMPSPNPLNTSPVLLRRAENEFKARALEKDALEAEIRALELKESSLLKEVSTSAMKEPSLGKLPPKNVRKNMETYKKLASHNVLSRGNRPKSAIGKSNGARAKLRMQRALEFEKQGGFALIRPSTASGSTARRSEM
ncbi:hypothetical protein TrRE_jg11670 [Triparma retinervis]|uniref:EF-hand domain-containing protein n=1 Tax=Triparma retinervis TaxID=2557542 RepID=A0A9W7FAA5_9STRA|nr:hypothetical protein TrRE_jg11670 [Triparma retinervis]